MPYRFGDGITGLGMDIPGLERVVQPTMVWAGGSPARSHCGARLAQGRVGVHVGGISTYKGVVVMRESGKESACEEWTNDTTLRRYYCGLVIIVFSFEKMSIRK